MQIALPCGGAVAVSLLNKASTPLVGIGVASTFLPPFINAGVLWGLATHNQIRGINQIPVPFNMSGTIVYLRPAYAPQAGYIPTYSYDMRVENALLACVSMALTMVNVICMLVVAIVFLWV